MLVSQVMTRDPATIGPDQTLEEIQSDIDEIIKLKSQHVSLYSLTIEKNSRFYIQNVHEGNDQYLAGKQNIVAIKTGGILVAQGVADI